jgi:signal transduction histidine kinase
VASLIENVLTHFAASTNLRDVSRDVTLQVAPKLHAWADKENSTKVIEHLITNAVKFSPPGAPIAITAQEVYAGRRRVFARMAHDENAQPDFVQINVRDQGLGIPRADIPKLFNRFVRLERDITGSVRGMGVGLYQCRLLVEAMGGQIWVESQGIEGYGSTFSFTLPAAPVPRDA